MGDIGEHDPAQRDHADIFIGGALVACALKFLEQGAVIHEWPGDKGKEAYGVFRFFGLHLADIDKVFHALLQGFDMAKHHRG